MQCNVWSYDTEQATVQCALCFAEALHLLSTINFRCIHLLLCPPEYNNNQCNKTTHSLDCSDVQPVDAAIVSYSQALQVIVSQGDSTRCLRVLVAFPQLLIRLTLVSKSCLSVNSRGRQLGTNARVICCSAFQATVKSLSGTQCSPKKPTFPTPTLDLRLSFLYQDDCVWCSLRFRFRFRFRCCFPL